ncbi:MAG: ABC transporter permease [Phycisphaerae bacterium]|jgi:ABC-2 type transport system permease protein
MIVAMRTAWAFFKRDAIIAMSYRTSFAVQLLGNFLLLGVFYYVGRTIGDAKLPALEPYGGNYLAFLLIGIALTDCVGISLTMFARQIREGQLTGVLEATLMTPVRLSWFLICSSLWGYFFAAIRFVFYIVIGALLYGVSLAETNILSTVVVFVFTVLCFAGIGIAWAAVVMLIKRGESIMTLMGYMTILLSGVLFPVAVLPGWLQWVAELVPLTHALDGMRFAVLEGSTLRDLLGSVLKLTVMAAVLMTGGLAAFAYAVRLAKQTGSLTEY